MRTRLALLAFGISLLTASHTRAEQVSPAATMNAHMGAPVYHAFRLETGLGRSHGQDTGAWDLDGWIGGDTHKLWLKSEGEITDGKTRSAEVWALYSRNVSTFWDAQVGVRADARPAGPDGPDGKGHSYLVAGVNGLAPYFFATEAHVFLRDDGALSARLREENEWLITNHLVMRPRLELNLNTRDDPKAGLGTGLTDVSIGVQTRYEVTRRFAPYIDLTYREKLGRTADYARLRSEKSNETRLSAGISWLF